MSRNRNHPSGGRKRRTHFLVGTSGYSYREWKGSFYPGKLPQQAMLGYYAERFSAVESNHTFYRLPSASVLTSWADEVPESFRFALKAPQTITHRKRLKSARRETAQFLRAASALKRRLGPVLFQLPPNFKKDLARLDAFLDLLDVLDETISAAFEFRHPSWFDEEVFASLRVHSCALCAADVDDSPDARLVRTAGWGYVRLRRQRYTDRRLATWIENIRSMSWDKTYVFFKHEETGRGPKLARRFLELADS